MKAASARGGLFTFLIIFVPIVSPKGHYSLVCNAGYRGILSAKVLFLNVSLETHNSSALVRDEREQLNGQAGDHGCN
jgi:hypothetical protein